MDKNFELLAKLTREYEELSFKIGAKLATHLKEGLEYNPGDIHYEGFNIESMSTFTPSANHVILKIAFSDRNPDSNLLDDMFLKFIEFEKMMDDLRDLKREIDRIKKQEA